ncbi:MAG: hypothetical protein LBS10_08165 [Gracilibacteraceae bacterium]|jgi:hypothetical protein|nr:hypothetical protein [Gracilibacteraceae bacterium]
MDYENLYAQFADQAVGVKARLKSLQGAWGRLAAKIENGDLKAAAKDLAAMEDAYAALADVMATARETVTGFDYAAYMASGDFARQFVDCCAAEGLEVRTENKTYEIFPFKIRLDAENCDILIDRRKAASLRPGKLAATIRKNREKLFSAPFDPKRFATEMAAAYDFCLLRQNSGKTVTVTEADILLRDIYAHLTPMQRFRHDYSLQAYAFDLARLFMHPAATAADGRRYQFGPSRYSSQAIRITDLEGNEHFPGTIRFLRIEE